MVENSEKLENYLFVIRIDIILLQYSDFCFISVFVYFKDKVLLIFVKVLIYLKGAYIIVISARSRPSKSIIKW